MGKTRINTSTVAIASSQDEQVPESGHTYLHFYKPTDFTPSREKWLDDVVADGDAVVIHGVGAVGVATLT